MSDFAQRLLEAMDRPREPEKGLRLVPANNVHSLMRLRMEMALARAEAERLTLEDFRGREDELGALLQRMPPAAFPDEDEEDD